MLRNSKLSAPIGVFDSGLGGLTVVKELMRQCPHENIVYFGDTARVPYGSKSKDSIVRFSVSNTKELLKHNVKMVVVACNSSSSYAMATLKKKFKQPIIGVIQPGAKAALDKTKNNRIGVIATSATIASNRYEQAIKRNKKNIKVFSQATPLFVPIVEEGWFDSAVALKTANEYLSGLKKKNIDTLILGCTHYPLLKKVISVSMGKKVALVDSAETVASQVKQYLDDEGLVNVQKSKGKLKIIINDRPQQFENIAKRFLGRCAYNITKVKNV